MKQWHKSRSFWEALLFALRGIAVAFIRERNMRIQLFLGTIILFVMIALRIPVVHIMVGIIALLLVIAFEMVNTAIELLVDLVHPEYSVVVRNIKDITAGSVLIVAVVVCMIFLFIFIPSIF